MRAVTRDIATELHFFSYGRWDSNWNEAADGNLPQLPEYTNTTVPPPAVTVTDFSSPTAINTVFSDAQRDSPFTYLRANKQKYAIKWDTPGIRVVSMPIPTRIIPAGYNTSARINDPNGRCQKYPGTCKDIGVATTHIFEYENAGSLTFGLDPNNTLTQAQDSTADYHFHTVPMPQGTSADPNAASLMFQAMLQLIDKDFPDTDITLTPPTLGNPIEMGPNVPNCVEPQELEIFPYDNMHQHTRLAVPNALSMHTRFNGSFATCGGGGLAMGDCC
jgi:hypothetical protein